MLFSLTTSYPLVSHFLVLVETKYLLDSLKRKITTWGYFWQRRNLVLQELWDMSIQFPSQLSHSFEF